MFTDLGEVMLKCGEKVRAGVVLGPDTEWAEKVESLLRHKGDPWNWQNHEVLNKDVGIEARFFLLHRDGEPFANVMTADLRGTGLFGHVWTKPEDRRRGACAALMRAAMADFASRDGQALFLGTGFDSPAYHLYAAHGFRGIEKESGLMAYYGTSEADFQQRYFDGSTTSVEPLAWRHWPASAALFLGEFPGVVRSVALGLLGRSLTEGALLPPIREGLARRARGEPPAALALVVPNGAVVGLATWAWHRTWPRTCTVDIHCHPRHWHEAPSLLASLALPNADRYVAYGDSGFQQKQEVLAGAAFTAKACFSKRVRSDTVGTSYVDVTEFEK